MKTLLSTVLMTVILLTTSRVVQAQVTPFDVQGYSFTLEVNYPVPPDTLFTIMTGDISGWWDHNVSGDPAEFYIDASPGGAFMEIYPDERGWIRHAVVTGVENGTFLRFEGPLGLAGRAFQMTTTWTFEQVPDGTKLIATINMMGQLDEQLANIVKQVWEHFLVEQLQPYVENGEWHSGNE